MLLLLRNDERFPDTDHFIPVPGGYMPNFIVYRVGIGTRVVIVQEIRSGLGLAHFNAENIVRLATYPSYPSRVTCMVCEIAQPRSLKRIISNSN